MKTLLLVILVIFVGAGVYFLFAKQRPLLSPRMTSINPSPTNITTTPQPTPDTTDLKAGGNSYLDPQGIYVFLYPSDYKLDTTDKQHIRIYKTGVIVVFETVNLAGKSLEQWVDAAAESKKSITQNNYPGFTYATRGLGTAKYYVLQKDITSQNAVVITTSVNDSQNVGFQQEVDKILSTLEILK